MCIVPAETCPPAPQESLVMFRESCEVSYPNVAAANTSFFDRGRCSNVMCATADGVCSNGSRCCCQDLLVSQVNYSCPNYNRDTPVGVDMVEQCGCQQCADVSVVFIGRVRDQMGIPLIITNITVGGTESYITDEFGLFVFAVPAEQESISVRVSPVQYLAFERTYLVIPGGIRILNIELKELLVVTFRPPEGDFFQSAYSLQVLSSQASLSAGESSIRYPSGTFSNDTDYTFIGAAISIGSDADIRALNLPFSATATVSGRRKSEGSLSLKARIQGEKTVKQASGVGTVLLSTASVGILMIADEDGIPIGPLTGGQPFVIGSVFNSQSYSTAELRGLTLYILNQTTQEFYRASDTPNVTSLESGLLLVEFTIYDVSFPLYYLVAFEEPSVCYGAVRAFDPSISSNMSEVGTLVRVTTKQGDVVNVVYAQTPACVPIPCSGNTTLQVAEDEGLYLPGDISTTISSQFGDGAVYQSLRACTAIGLVSTNPLEYFNFTLSLSLLLTSPSLPIGLESPPFCTLKVEVTASVGSTVEVAALLQSGIMVMERITATASDSPTALQQEFGSAFANSTEQTSCLWIPCSSQQVTIAATVAETSEPCLPLQGRATTSTANLDLLQNVALPSTFDFTFQVPADTSSVVGIQRSEEWAELAYYMCLIQEDIGIAFQCIQT